jgi:hypothetical protein
MNFFPTAGRFCLGHTLSLTNCRATRARHASGENGIAEILAPAGGTIPP